MPHAISVIRHLPSCMSCINGSCCALSWQLIRSFAAKKEAEVEVASRVNEARDKAEFRIAHGITKEEYESIIAEAFRCVAASLFVFGVRPAWSAHPCDSARDCGEHRPRRSDAPATLQPCECECGCDGSVAPTAPRATVHVVHLRTVQGGRRGWLGLSLAQRTPYVCQQPSDRPYHTPHTHTHTHTHTR